MPTMGELCAGGGMLTRALENLFGVTSVWHAETDQAASKVLDAYWPGVPNLGDITAVDWSAVEPVGLLAAGFPCQGFSMAGKRGGSADERHLWPVGVLPGIEALMPPVVALENVPGLLTIERGAVFGQVLADLDRLGYTVAWTVVGACKVGACHHRHRLFVLAVRSEDVRVPSQEPIAGRHGDVWLPVQQVLFGDAESVKWPPSGVSRSGLVWPLPVETCGDGGVVLLPTPRVTATRASRSAITGSASSPSLEQALELARGEVPRELRGLGEVPASWDLLPTPTATLGRGTGFPSAETAQRRMDAGKRFLDDAVALLPTPTAGERRGRHTSPEVAAHRLDSGRRNLEDAVALLPTPRATDTGTPGRRASEGFRPPLSQVILPMFPTPTARDAGRGAGKPFAEGRPLSEVVALLPSDARGVDLLPTPRASDGSKGGPNQRGSSGDLMLPSAVQPGRFGKYEPAVRRHELAFNLPVPAPTEPGRAGNPRLAAPFPEWMMSCPRGYLTDVVSRNDALRIAGNGVFGPVVGYALPSLPTFAAAVALLSRERLGVAA